MKKIIVYTCILIAGAMAFAATAAQNDDVKAAAARLAASQQLGSYLPMIIRNASIDSIEKVKRGAMLRLESNAALSDAQRTRAMEIIDQFAPQIAADMDALHRTLDANALVLEMIETVYPKYFSQAEMQSLAEFYESTAFHKVARNELSVFKKNLETLLTPQEKQLLMNFYNSSLGQKQRNPQIAQESLAFMRSRVDPMIAALVAPYGEKMSKELQNIH